MSMYDEIIKEYESLLRNLQIQNEVLRDKYSGVSTSQYSLGTPNLEKNRGDESDAFAFPYNFAKTCKNLANSPYAESILTFFNMTFDTFNYFIEPPKKDFKYSKQIEEFLNIQFDRAGGLKRLITSLAENALIYGFNYFTSKVSSVNGRDYGFKNRLYQLDGYKYYDPAFTTRFIYSSDDIDEVESVVLFSADKTIGTKSKDDILNDIINMKEVIGKETVINFERGLGGLITYGNNYGDAIGKPFLYSNYGLTKLLSQLDDSFAKNLDSFGEHSYNFIPHSPEEINSIDREEILREVRKFIKDGGGVFISKYGKIEKMSGVNGNSWYNLRDGLIATVLKSKSLEIKALGMTRGATRDLAQLSQQDTILMASHIIDNFIYQLNNTFMKYYFDANFKIDRLNGLCDYFKIGFEVTKETGINKDNQNSEQVALSRLRSDDKKGSGYWTYDRDTGNYATIDYDSKGNVKKRETVLKLKDNRFVKSVAEPPVDFVVDSTDIENTLLSTSNDLSNYLSVKMRESIRNKDLIKAQIKKDKKAKTIGFYDRKGIEEEIKNILRDDINKMVETKARESVRGLGRNGASLFEKYTGTNMTDFVYKETNKIMNKSGNRLVRQIVDKAEDQLREDLKFYTDSADLDKNIDESVDDIYKNVDMNYEASGIKKITDRETVNAFQDVSNTVVEDIAKKKEVAIIRVGILESACEVCKSRAGIVYIKDENNNWVNDEYPYYKLPDSECKGGKYRCNCYYAVVDRDMLDNYLFIENERKKL